MKKLYFPLIALIGLCSCEDPVDIEIDNGVTQIAVDAFINSLDTIQTISLKQSKDFFDGSSQEPVLGANVKVTDSQGREYAFLDNDGIGEYSWNDSVLAHENLTYNLQISYDGELYTAEELANPVPVIDSLVAHPPGEGFGGGRLDEESDLQLELYSIDLAGREDYYWIKVFRNDTIDDRSDAINVTQDAGGEGSDGVLFIPPVRVFGINNRERPYQAGEHVKVQIHSINKNTYFFFSQVINQINNGGLFAVPASNVRTNIESSSTETAKTAIGMFSVSIVSEISKDL